MCICDLWMIVLIFVMGRMVVIGVKSEVLVCFVVKKYIYVF